jgi:type II secretory pathway component PulM
LNQNESLDKNLVAMAATAIVFVLFLAIYAIPRSSTLRETRNSIDELQTVRQEVAVLLPEVARTVPTTPLPQPDVRTWIANNSLAGIEKNLIANDGYDQGKGAQVKLRRLRPEDAAQFMSNLTRVRLVVERMQLQDSDGDGRWDMEISLKVPE